MEHPSVNRFANLWDSEIRSECPTVSPKKSECPTIVCILCRGILVANQDVTQALHCRGYTCSMMKFTCEMDIPAGLFAVSCMSNYPHSFPSLTATIPVFYTQTWKDAHV